MLHSPNLNLRSKLYKHHKLHRFSLYQIVLDLISATSVIDLLLNEIIFLKKRSSVIWKMTVYVGSGFHTSSPTYKNPCIDITSFFARNIAKLHVSSLWRWKRKTLLIWTSCSSEGPSKAIYKYNAKQGLPGHLFVKQLKSSLQDCFVD